MNELLRDSLAELQHNIWSRWMKHLFSLCETSGDENYVVIPDKYVDRWVRQMFTAYENLSSEEKLSDLQIADEVVETINSFNQEHAYNQPALFDMSEYKEDK